MFVWFFFPGIAKVPWTLSYLTDVSSHSLPRKHLWEPQNITLMHFSLTPSSLNLLFWCLTSQMRVSGTLWAPHWGLGWCVRMWWWLGGCCGTSTWGLCRPTVRKERHVVPTVIRTTQISSQIHLLLPSSGVLLSHHLVLRSIWGNGRYFLMYSVMSEN